MEISLLSLIIGAAAGIISGVSIGYLLFSKKRDMAQLQSEIKHEKLRAESKVSSATGELNRVKSELKNVSLLISILPQLYAKLPEQSTPEDVAKIFLMFLEKVFEAGQLAFFFFNPAVNSLELKAKKGLPEQIPLGYRVVLGEGKIGWAAQKRQIMDEKDYETETYMVRQELEKTTTIYFKVEMCIPIVFYDELLGIVSIGNMLKRFDSEKQIIQSLSETITPFLKNAIESRRKVQSPNDAPTSVPSTKDRLVDKAQFIGNLDQCVEMGRNSGGTVAIAFFEIDDFHIFVQNHGISSGENAITLASKIILAATENAELRGRFEESLFCVSFVNQSANEVYKAAETVRSKIESYPFPVDTPREAGHLTVSVGLGIFPNTADTIDNLLSYAFQHAQAAHSEGGNRIMPDLPELVNASSTDFSEVDILTAFDE